MSTFTYVDKANAGDPITIDWINWGILNHRECEANFPYPSCNIIASEQLWHKSAKEKRCYLCGHKTDHRQTTAISFPPLAKHGWICAECDA